MTIIDTGALIDYLVDGSRAADVESCLADGEAAVSAISVYELPAGVSSDRHVAQRMELVSLTTVIAGYQ